MSDTAPELEEPWVRRRRALRRALRETPLPDRTTPFIEQMHGWLRLEGARGPIATRNEHMPDALRTGQNVDRLCSVCASVPWKNIETVMRHEMDRVGPATPSDDLFRTTGFQSPKYTLSSLRYHLMSAFEGCHLCTLILIAMLARGNGLKGTARWREYHQDTRDPDIGQLVRALDKLDLDEKIEMTYNMIPDGYFRSNEWMLHFLHSEYESGQLQVSFSSAAELAPSAEVRRGGSTVDFARHWLDICDRQHDCCQVAADDIPVLPTRVIRLHEDNGQLKANVHITGGEKAQYTALSHCWSSSYSVQSLTSNLHKLQNNIDISLLSDTFRDAFIITHGLGLSYIWIDSLCILQDNEEDWVRESANMCNIYRHAYLTIGAFTSSEDVGMCATAYAPNLADNACQIAPNFYIHEDDYAFSYPYQLPGKAQTRGWILQEEQLSPRRLYCGQHHLVWQCGEMFSRNDRPFSFTGKGFHRSLIFSSETSPGEAFSRWRRLVEMYTHRNLTFANDKLPAISGLAVLFNEKFPRPPITYLAGIWREDILLSLLWHRGLAGLVPNEEECLNQDGRCIAPSWSWASKDGPIKFEHEDRHANGGIRCGGPRQRSGVWKCKILESSVSVVSNSPFLRVSSGRLVIHSKVLLDVWYIKQQDEKKIRTNPGPRVKCPNPKVHLDFRDWFPQNSVLLQMNERAGLLLEPVGNDHFDGRYRRIGLCTRDKFDYDSVWLPDGQWTEKTLTII